MAISGGLVPGVSTITLATLLAAAPAAAQESQEPGKGEAASAATRRELPERVLPADMALSKAAEATIRGARVPYRVTTGTQPVYGGRRAEPSPPSTTPGTSAATSRTPPGDPSSSPSTAGRAPAPSGCISATPARSFS